MAVDLDCCYRRHRNRETSLKMHHRSDNYYSHLHYYCYCVDWETIAPWKHVKMVHVVLVQHKPRLKIGRMLAWLKVLVSAQFLTDLENFNVSCKL